MQLDKTDGAKNVLAHNTESSISPLKPNTFTISDKSIFTSSNNYYITMFTYILRAYTILLEEHLVQDQCTVTPKHVRTT